MTLDEAKNTCQKYGVIFSTDMPEGYENAYGTFDVTINTLFFNTNTELSTDYERDFYLFHELRHSR